MEACRTLEVFAFSFNSGVGRLLGLIPSDSISLIHLHNPRPRAPLSPEGLRSLSVELFDHYVSDLEQIVVPECRYLGISLKKIARRFRDHHPGLKTQIRIHRRFADSDTDTQPLEYVDIPFLKAELKKEVGDYVTFETARKI